MQGFNNAFQVHGGLPCSIACVPVVTTGGAASELQALLARLGPEPLTLRDQLFLPLFCLM